MSRRPSTVTRRPTTEPDRLRGQWPDQTVGDDLRAILRPERRWHFLLHLYVVLVCSSYWISAGWSGGGASLAELAIYRPGGDLQLYPTIRALSEANLGDPTDAIQHGQGLLSFPAVVLIPHALLRAVMGDAGYVVGDAVLPWFFFVALTLLLRQCRLGGLTSLILSALVTTGGLTAAVAPLADGFERVAESLGWRVWEPGLPNLARLELYGLRIHRPMITETFVVLTLYLLLKTAQEARVPGARRGLVFGVLMALLFQGDIYSTAALGLMWLAILGWLIRRTGKVVPAAFGGGVLAGAVLAGWFLVLQRLFEHPDVVRRIGLVDYPRWPLLFLPGHGWLLRIGVVALLGLGVWRLARRRDAEAPPAVAVFWVGVVVFAGLAQPVQIALLGKQVQIYHYGHNLKVFYSYAVVILSCLALALLTGRARWWMTTRTWLTNRRWRWAGALSVLLIVGAALASSEAKGRHAYQGHPQGASTETQPWAAFGADYRPALRELEGVFRNNDALRSARTFSTFNQDAYVLLTAFLGKRAFTPDVAMSTLTDSAIERRLLIMALLMQLDPERLQQWLGDYYVLNTFFGANKYRFATDYRFSRRPDDYPPVLLKNLADPRHPQQDGWTLVLPFSERLRMMTQFEDIPTQVSPEDPSFPEVIVLCPSPIEAFVRLAPHPAFYRPVFTNRVFQVFLRNRP